MENKNYLKYFVDVLMAISFLIVTVTGIFKLPKLIYSFRSIYEIISPQLMRQLHDWSGVALAILVLFHLVLNWTWIKAMTKSIFTNGK